MLFALTMRLPLYRFTAHRGGNPGRKREKEKKQGINQRSLSSTLLTDLRAFWPGLVDVPHQESPHSGRALLP